MVKNVFSLILIGNMNELEILSHIFGEDHFMLILVSDLEVLF